MLGHTVMRTKKLCGLLDAAPRFSYRNYSVLRDNLVHTARKVQALYDAIKERMAFCEVVLIMTCVYATYSNWIQREICIAKVDFDKPIVAVKPWGNTRVSAIGRDNVDRPRIPVRLDSDSGGKWTPVPVQSGQRSERSDAGVGL